VTRRSGKKIAQILEKEAKTVAKPKRPQYFHLSSILKSKTSILPPSEIYKYLQQTVFSPKNILAFKK
jgi:hypothetical protein